MRLTPRSTSRCALADIGSHWCDMIEHVTGLRITSLCADLQTSHTTRKRPKGSGLSADFRVFAAAEIVGAQVSTAWDTSFDAELGKTVSYPYEDHHLV